MPAAFPTTNHANDPNAVSDLVNRSISAGYTPSAALDTPGVVYSILANMFTAFPSTAVRYFTATVTPGNVAANATVDTDVTYTGVAATDRIVGIQTAAALDAGIAIGDVRVKQLNTVTVRVANVTGGAIEPVTPFGMAIYVVSDPDPA